MVHTVTVTDEDINSLLTHPRNPRQGNIDTIAASIAEHGLYRPVVAQTSTRHILAGNHTLQAAKQLGHTTIPVTWVDCDDARAEKILLIDNKISDDANYDMQMLFDMLDDMPGIDGTGYNMDDMDRLATEVLNDLPDLAEIELPVATRKSSLEHAANAASPAPAPPAPAPVEATTGDLEEPPPVETAPHTGEPAPAPQPETQPDIETEPDLEEEPRQGLRARGISQIVVAVTVDQHKTINEEFYIAEKNWPQSAPKRSDILYAALRHLNMALTQHGENLEVAAILHQWRSDSDA